MKKINFLCSFSLALSALVCISACSKDDDECGNHDAVDLGLTSGIKWAKTNVGANNSWDYGSYFSWGETIVKSDYNWDTYKYCKGSHNSLTKYCDNSDYGKDGFTDALTTLVANDDAATTNWGNGWETPTAEDWEELSNLCYWIWTSDYSNTGKSGFIVYKTKQDGDKGMKAYVDSIPSTAYSLSDAHIFLPVAGYRDDTILVGEGDFCYYWTASLDEYYPSGARLYHIDRVFISISNKDRYCGMPIRPIRRK